MALSKMEDVDNTPPLGHFLPILSPFNPFLCPKTVPPRVETCILCQEDQEVTSSSICQASSSSSSAPARSGIVVMAALAQRSNVLAATGGKEKVTSKDSVGSERWK